MADQESVNLGSSTFARSARRPLALDADVRIAEDVHCQSCGYNLLGLAPDAACPECAAPVERSVRGDLLRFSHPLWLARVARGLLLVFVGYIGVAIVGVGAPFVGASLVGSGSTAASTVIAILAFLRTSIAAVIVLGVWWTTTPEPGWSEREGFITARRLARWCFVATIIAAPIQLWSPTGGMTIGQPITVLAPGALTLIAAGIGLGTVGLVGLFAGLVYLRRLARRIPRPSLVTQTGVVMWGFGITQAVGVLLGLGFLLVLPRIVAAGGTPIPTPGILIVTAGGCIVAGGTLGFGIFALVLTCTYRNALLKAAAQSRAAWIDP